MKGIKIFKYTAILMLVFNHSKAEDLAHDLNHDTSPMQQWERGFNRYLLQHEDANLQAYGLFNLTSLSLHGESDLDDPTLAEYKKILASLVEDKSLNYQSMFLLLTACHAGKVVQNCDYFKLAENLMQLHSDNMASYLFSLSLAKLNKVEGEIIALVRAMANAEFINTYLHVSEAYDEVLATYAEKLPLPDSAFKYEADISLAKESFTQAKLKSVEENSSEYRLFMYKNLNNLQMPIPTYRALIDACKEYMELYDDCLSISEVFKKSGRWIPESLGHSIQIDLIEKSGNSKAHKLAVERKEQLKITIDCLVSASKMPSLFKLNLEHASQRMQVTRDQGERAGMYYYAKLKYHEAIEQGESITEFQNPDLCLGKEQVGD